MKLEGIRVLDYGTVGLIPILSPITGRLNKRVPFSLSLSPLFSLTNFYNSVGPISVGFRHSERH